MSEERLYEFKRQWLPVYFILLIALLLVAVHFVILYAVTGTNSYANMAVVSGLGAYFFYNGFQRLRAIRVVRRRVLELVKCRDCGYSEEREYSAGDYVFMRKGECPRCGGTMIVAGIYSVEIEGARKAESA
ncbi:MAG TPA: hypothetical protein ENG30_03550 [Thermofilaceae archaeon]|nr:hypothetical protein [Thermofilaceae archaeon]